MSRVIQIGIHHLHACRSPGCYVCEGSLALCEVCHGGEASLPTHCPGRGMTAEEQDAVVEGVLDYDRLLGWVCRPSELAEFCRRDHV